MGERVLLVAGDAHVKATVGVALAAEGGFDVALADGRAQAADRILAAGPFALVLYDRDAHDMGGVSALVELMGLNRPHPVALMSATLDRAAAAAAIAEGAAGFVPKSMPARSLIHAVRLMLAGEQYAPIAFLTRPPAPPVPHGARLSRRESEVLDGLCRGLANKEIARELGVAEVTVKLHVRTLCRKLDAKNRTHAAMIARDARIL